MTQEEKDKAYLKMAQQWATNSYAIRLNVGCLIVKNDQIISDGFNGTPSGMPNVCEYAYDDITDTSINVTTIDELHDQELVGLRLMTHPYVLHAESNALAKCAKNGVPVAGATLYVTDEPCMECAKLIIQCGIKRVVYARSYRLHQGLELLRQCNIDVEHIAMNY